MKTNDFIRQAFYQGQLDRLDQGNSYHRYYYDSQVAEDAWLRGYEYMEEILSSMRVKRVKEKEDL